MPKVTFRSADGLLLEGRLTRPERPNGGVAVVCHPHPLYGGSMDSWMPPVLQRALVGDGWIGLRFNFRGVGGSEGSYERGEGELADVAGAIERALAEAGDPEAPLVVGGWSFGALVSLRAALAEPRTAGWFGVSLPWRTRAVDVPTVDAAALASWRPPKLFVHGTRDQFCPVEVIRDIVARAAGPKRLVEIPGGDHFLAEHGDRIGAEVVALGRDVLAAAPPARGGDA